MHRIARLALPAVVAVIAATASIAPGASAAERYASPTGTGADCTAEKPCSLRKAVEGENVSAVDEVIVAPGDYELTTTLTTPTPMTIHGVPGLPRPLLRLKTGVGAQEGLQVFGSTLRHVEIEQAPGNPWTPLTAVNSSVDRVIARGSGWVTADIRSTMIRNSIVVSSRDLGIALYTGSNPAPRTGTYRNVTAIATGTGGVAIQAQAASGGNATVLARNVIARGGPGGADLRAFTSGDPAEKATITVDHSNYVNGSLVGGGSIVDAGKNQSSAPVFVDAAAGDYRQAAGSPTIDGGLDEFINGDFDIDGDLREIGATDIGADEYYLAPAASTGAADAVTEDSATLSGMVKANGFPTSYHFEYGPTTAYGTATPTMDAGAGGTIGAKAMLSGLDPSTTYYYRLVATGWGVVSNGADRTFTTASPAQPTPSTTPPTSTTPGPSTPPLPFAGVKLDSRRLPFAGRFVTLKLTCPAAAVDRCSGRARLTVRRTSARRLTLGRASFSIAAGARAMVRVRVTRAGRLLLGRTRRVRAKDVNLARDGAGRSKTTTAAVTIRHRRR